MLLMLSEAGNTADSVLTMIAIGIWWIYFDFISQQRPKPSRNASYVWLYLHLPITLGIVTTGAAIVNALAHTDSVLNLLGRLLLSESLGLTLICIFLLMQNLHIPESHKKIYFWGKIITIFSGLVVGAIGFVHLNTTLFLCAIVGVLLVPVIFGAIVWIKLSMKEN